MIPIADRHADYAHDVLANLRAAGLRAEIDARSERMNSKIRDAQLQKIPYMLVVGDREAEAQAVAVRTRAGEDLKSMPVFQFIDRLQDEIATAMEPEAAGPGSGRVEVGVRRMEVRAATPPPRSEARREARGIAVLGCASGLAGPTRHDWAHRTFASRARCAPITEIR